MEAMYQRLQSFSAAGKFLWPIPDKGLKRRIHRIKAPTLIIWGEADYDFLNGEDPQAVLRRSFARALGAVVTQQGPQFSGWRLQAAPMQWIFVAYRRPLRMLQSCCRVI